MGGSAISILSSWNTRILLGEKYSLFSQGCIISLQYSETSNLIPNKKAVFRKTLHLKTDPTNLFLIWGQSTSYVQHCWLYTCASNLLHPQTSTSLSSIYIASISVSINLLLYLEKALVLIRASFTKWCSFECDEARLRNRSLPHSWQRRRSFKHFIQSDRYYSVCVMSCTQRSIRGDIWIYYHFINTIWQNEQFR